MIDNNVLPTNYKAVRLRNFGESSQFSLPLSFYIAKPHAHISTVSANSFANSFSLMTDVNPHRTGIMNNRRDKDFINLITDGIVEQLWHFSTVIENKPDSLLSSESSQHCSQWQNFMDTTLVAICKHTFCHSDLPPENNNDRN